MPRHSPHALSSLTKSKLLSDSISLQFGEELYFSPISIRFSKNDPLAREIVVDDGDSLSQRVSPSPRSAPPPLRRSCFALCCARRLARRAVARSASGPPTPARYRSGLRRGSLRSERRLVGVTGVEPVTSSLSGTRSNQLSYTPLIARASRRRATKGELCR